MLQKVTLTKPHTHAGKDYKAGDQIEVNAADKAWLEERGIISKSAAKAERQSASAPAATSKGDN